MKTLFLEARYKEKVTLPKDVIDKLPKKIALFTTIQYLDSLEDIKAQLVSAGKDVILAKGKHSKYRGQLLGCDIKSLDLGIDPEIDAFLYIGDGMFHPKALLLRDEKPIFVFNPLSKILTELDESHIKKIRQKQKVALLKFHSASDIGILVTTKPGQHRLKDAIYLKDKLKDKRCYIFITDTLDFSQLENFPFIGCWVNTMCPRIALDDILPKSIINIDDIDL